MIAKLLQVVNMKNKGIAVNTILMLLVGIIVVGIIIILVYKYVLGPQLGEPECKAKAISWCSDCKNAGWIDTAPTMSTELQTCADKFYMGRNGFTCRGPLDANKIWCTGFIGLS
jgi:hypothetical protein